MNKIGATFLRKKTVGKLMYIQMSLDRLVGLTMISIEKELSYNLDIHGWS